MPAALWELARAWNGAELFEVHVARRLGGQLRRLDAKQQPELYDAHRRYDHTRAPDLIDHDPRTESTEPEHAEPADLAQSLQAAGIAGASQAGAIRLVGGVRDGAVHNGYTAARALGAGRSEAQRGAATAQYLYAVRLVAEHTVEQADPLGLCPEIHVTEPFTLDVDG